MKNPYWDGKIHKQAKFGDIAIKGTVKEQQTRLPRQQFARREAEAAIACHGVRAIGAVLDFAPPTAVLLRPSYEKSGPGCRVSRVHKVL
jgi:hypothetical protein